jgi:hypothetical protein
MRLTLGATAPFDAWRRPNPATEQDPATGQLLSPTSGTRVGEDVILTNVLSFDVKVWDPGAPIVTLNDPSQTINGEAIQPGDPPIRESDGMGGFLDTPAVFFALKRVNSLTDPTNDLDGIVGFGAYVDLNYMCRMGPNLGWWDPDYRPTNMNMTPAPAPSSLPQPQFHHPGDIRSGLFGTAATFKFRSSDFAPDELRPSVYDTYSTHYESDGINQGNAVYDYTWRVAPTNPPAPSPTWPTDAGINGIDDDGDGAVDETTQLDAINNGINSFSGENETAPPYPHPLRGIQIKIRVFEPDTRQIREVTLEHEFLPQ